MKKTKTQKGITLIALIITIIVLLILAVVAISAVQDSGIIVKAKDATKQYAIAKEKEQITLAYTNYMLDKKMAEVESDSGENPGESGDGENSGESSEEDTLKVPGATVTETEDGFIVEFPETGNVYSVSQDGKPEFLRNNKEDVGGENAGEGNTVPGGGTDSGETGDGEDTPEPIVHGGTIPNGGVYKRIAEDETETIYVAGDAFPEVVLDGDIYIYEDYEYRYNYVCFALSEAPTWMDVQSINQGLAEEGVGLPNGGWGVRVTDPTKEAYTDMITTINGQDVTNLFCTYTACTSLTSMPRLSDKTKDITYGFAVCMALTEVSNLPDSITNMMNAFNSCSSLTTVSDLPDNVTNMMNAFHSCSSLTTVSDLPDNVTNMEGTFDQCASLTTVPAIPSSVTNMERTFGCCDALATAPDMSKATNVTNMKGTFEECTSLTGVIEINADPSEYENCFMKTKQKILITGAAPDAKKAALAKTGSGNLDNEQKPNVTWE